MAASAGAGMALSTRPVVTTIAPSRDRPHAPITNPCHTSRQRPAISDATRFRRFHAPYISSYPRFFLSTGSGSSACAPKDQWPVGHETHVLSSAETPAGYLINIITAYRYRLNHP